MTVCVMAEWLPCNVMQNVQGYSVFPISQSELCMYLVFANSPGITKTAGPTSHFDTSLADKVI